ncbi:hypothetical protein F5X99DRAFT_370621 [Biscogniauxia marginata]|nr:hypothetical protein F5X99DRAFT_370621 [Biscogniauxia marginata]
MSSVGANAAIALTVVFLIGLALVLVWKGKQMTRNFALMMFATKQAQARREQRAAARAEAEAEGHEMQSTESSV